MEAINTPLPQLGPISWAVRSGGVEAAGGSLRNVVQVIIYLTGVSEYPVVNDVWTTSFSEPWPNRATLGVAALAVPGMKIEIVATAVIPHPEN